MKYNALIINLLILLLPVLSLAQPRTSNRFELEVDPIAFLLNGYSFHAGYTIDRIRVDIGAFGIKQPDFAVTNDNFSIFSSGVGVKVDYLLQDTKGLFFGLQSDYFVDRIRLKIGSGQKKTAGVNLGPRVGYRLMFGKSETAYRGLYLAPWVALLYQPNAKAVHLEGQTYQQATWSVFPTVHIGYRF